ncbi:C39 family peptidase [Luteococcus peritonei]|uniref:C39 family peptidase n=1 Tax=Luteococcus peritonei TaxID=88874 RepID=A0ABW4RY65_9ACTN
MSPENHPLSRRSLLLAGAGGLALGASGVAELPALAATARRSSLTRYSGTGFTGGHNGTAATTAGLLFSRSVVLQRWNDVHTGRRLTFELAQWTGPVVNTGYAATELVASWNAATPVGTAVRIKLRARNAAGTWSRWFDMALWGSSSANATSPTRTTYNGQSDAVARVATDTLKAVAGTSLTGFQLRIDLLRSKGVTAKPVVRQAAVVASTTPQSSTPVSPVGVARSTALAVPAYSQMLHVGHYPAWNGGGEAWCSATSVAMVLDFWKKGASAAETAWVRPTPHTNPQVEQVVRGVWDAGYKGTGNWPFNVAYAHARGLSGFVTRLRSLTEAELFIKAGIPLVVSTSFSSSQLSGAGFGTNGHLMVIKGFDASGNVRVNDPASSLKASNALVPRTYNRAQFESAWGRSGGLAYVIHPAGRTLPAKPAGAAW